MGYRIMPVGPLEAANPRRHKTCIVTFEKSQDLYARIRVRGSCLSIKGSHMLAND
jgi:hypothetical protein